jgi:hypothetical protein
MPRKVFEGFTPLDAEDVNEFLMDQAVMSFAGTAARGSALPSPNHGMASWLQDSDSFEIYNGSSWGSLGSQPTLVFIGSESFSGVASASIDNVFSADYTNYKAVVNVTGASINDVGFRMRVRASGSDLTTSTYERGRYVTGARSAQPPETVNSTLSTEISTAGMGDSVGYAFEANFHNPFTLTATKVFTIGVGRTLDFTGTVVIDSLAYDGFSVYCTSGNITGTMTVYGIREN